MKNNNKKKEYSRNAR